MDFDFYQTYTSYSNAALLQIISTPDGYQSEAVAAAQAVLDTRTITEADHAAASPSIAPVSTPAPGYGIFDEEAPLRPSLRFQQIKWMIIITTGIPFLNSLYIIGKAAYLTMMYGYLGLNGFLLGLRTAFDLLAFTILYLFAGVRRTGWILTASLNLWLIVQTLIQLCHIWYDPYSSRIDPLKTGMLAANVAAVYLLFRRQLYSWYVEEGVFRKYCLWGLLCTAAYFAVTYFINFVASSGASI